jgi:hypothetical protein
MFFFVLDCVIGQPEFLTKSYQVSYPFIFIESQPDLSPGSLRS